MANGATVQISFANNVVRSSTGLADFNGDLTGDGGADVMGKWGQQDDYVWRAAVEGAGG